MIKYYCDRCGRFMPKPKHEEVNICISGILTVDLCDRCAEDYDKMAIHFVNGYKETMSCFDCKYHNNLSGEEPCFSCLELGGYINFEKRDEEVEEDEQAD